MKRNLTILIIVCGLFAANIIFADEINVPPGVPDALFNAVSAANAGDVFILADGGIYPNSAVIPVSVPITIKTIDGAAAKARIVPLADASNAYPWAMFQADASLTLKNIIANGQQGTLGAYTSRFITRGTIGTGGKIHVDGVEVSRFTAVSMGGDVDSLICENSFFCGNLSVAGGWGGTWDFQGDIIKYAKIQNNTFMYCTFGPYLGNGWGNYAPAERQQPTLIIDHNTMWNITGAHGPTTMFCRVENVKFTNNLYINGTMRPNEFFSDKYIDFPQNADDISEFYGQITKLGPKGLWLISAEMVDSAGTVIDMRNNNITYTSDVLDAWTSRGLEPCWVWSNETSQAIIDTVNAYFAEDLAFTNAPATPMFAIEAIADNVVTGNADPVAHEGETPFKGWDWFDGLNANFDLREKSEMDMSYNTDSRSYTAAEGGFPLGDLNWFPDKKAEWEEWENQRSKSNMLANGDFSQGDANWTPQVIAPAEASFSFDNEVCYVDVKAVSSEEWHINILQEGVTMEPGTYTLTFDAKAEADKQVTAKAQLDHDPWTSTLDKPIMINTSMRTYTVTWDQTEASTTFKVGLFFGSDMSDVWLDNIKLTAESTTGVKSKVSPPKDWALMQNYPNPFNPVTNIAYTIPKNEKVLLQVYNVLGQEITTLVDEQKQAGTHVVRFDASQMNSGVYFYSLRAGSYHQVRKMIVMK